MVFQMYQIFILVKNNEWKSIKKNTSKFKRWQSKNLFLYFFKTVAVKIARSLCMKKKIKILKITALLGLLLFRPYVLSAQSAVVSGLIGLDEALQAAARTVEANLAPRTEIAVYKISAEHEEISNYLCDDLNDIFVRNGKLLPLAREAALRAVDAEQKYQMSGLVSDASIVGIGHNLGAKVVITGTFDRYADFSQLRLRAIDVRSSRLVAAYTARIRNKDTVLLNITTPYVTAPLPKVSENVLAILNRGKDLYAEGKNDAAILEFDRALASDKNLGEALLYRGNAYSEKKDFDRAIADYTQAIRIDPNYVLAYNNRGITYYEKGLYDIAIMDYNQALRLNPNSADTYNNLGLAYFEKKDFDRAITDYTQSIRIDPNYALAYINRGNTYNEKGLLDIAIMDYNQALRLNPNLIESYYNRGLAYLKKKDFDLAITDFTQAILISPNNAAAYSMRGLTYFRMKGNIERAIADYNQALHLNPNDAIAHFNRGNSYFFKRDYGLAIIDFEATLRINPNHSGAKVWLENARLLQRR
jgi:tetratricopeptide (TPR) repeat protein